MTQRSIFDRFFKAPYEGERLIGTHLYPLVCFCRRSGLPFSSTDDATEVLREIPVGLRKILVTRIGGLFVRVPGRFSDPCQATAPTADGRELREKLQFQREISDLLNRVVCELALADVVTDPVSPVHISLGHLIEQHALITVGGGGREAYLERTLEPTERLLRPGGFVQWTLHPESVLDRAEAQYCTSRLLEVSSSLPTFVAGAYSSFSRGQVGEALNSSWIVVEQILNHLWDVHISPLPQERKRRMKDHRAFTAAVKIEVMETSVAITTNLAEAFHKARSHRNALEHGAEVSMERAQEGMNAMKAAIEFICGQPVAYAHPNEAMTW